MSTIIKVSPLNQIVKGSINHHMQTATPNNQNLKQHWNRKHCDIYWMMRCLGLLTIVQNTDHIMF